MSSSISNQIEIAHAKKTIGDLEKKKLMASGSLSDGRKKLEALNAHIRYLKTDPAVVIVSMAEFKTLLAQRTNCYVKIAVWTEALKQLEENIKLLQERCRVLELADEQAEESPDPEPLAPILRFPIERTTKT